MKNKGLSTTQDGISQCNTGHNLYEVRSIPRKNTENQNVSKQRQIEQQVLFSLQRSKKTKKIRRILHHITFILFAPPYFILYRFPRWIFLTTIRPVLILIGNSVKRMIAIYNKIAARINFHFKKVQNFINKIKKIGHEFYLLLQKLRQTIKIRVVDPILSPFRTITKAIRYTRSTIAALRTGMQEFISATYHKNMMKVKSLSPFNLIPSSVKGFPETLKKAIKEFYYRINIFSRKKKIKDPLVDYYFPVEEEVKPRFPTLDKAKNHFQKEVRNRALAVNNRIDPFRTFVKGFKKGAVEANFTFFALLESATNAASNYLRVKTQKANKVINRTLEPYVIRFEAKMQIVTKHCNGVKNRVLEKCRSASNKVKKRILTPLQKKIEPYWNAAIFPFTIIKQKSQKLTQGISKKYYSAERNLTKFRDSIIDPFRLPIAYMRIVPKYSLEILKEAFAEVREKQLSLQKS